MTKSLRDEIEEAAKLFSEYSGNVAVYSPFIQGATDFAIRALEMAVEGSEFCLNAAQRNNASWDFLYILQLKTKLSALLMSLKVPAEELEDARSHLTSNDVTRSYYCKTRPPEPCHLSLFREVFELAPLRAKEYVSTYHAGLSEKDKRVDADIYAKGYQNGATDFAIRALEMAADIAKNHGFTFEENSKFEPINAQMGNRIMRLQNECISDEIRKLADEMRGKL